MAAKSEEKKMTIEEAFAEIDQKIANCFLVFQVLVTPLLLTVGAVQE